MQSFSGVETGSRARGLSVGRWIAVLLALAVVSAGLALARPALAQGGAVGGEILLGEEEPVRLVSDAASVEVLAKVDTGAGYSSIDEELAEDVLKLDLENADIVEIESSMGDEERPLVPVRMRVAGEMINTKVTVSDRDGLSKDMLLGSNELEGFLVKPGVEQLTSPDSPRVESPVAALLEFPPPPPSAPLLLAALPLAAAFVVAARTLVGLKTFGLFAPVLLSLAFVQVGLPAGLAMLGITLAAGLLVQPLLRPLRLPRVARLAVLMTVVTSVLLATNVVIDNPAVGSTWAAAFPVVVTAVVMERFSDTWEQENLAEALKALFLTLLAAMLAAPILVAEPVRWAAEGAPFLLGFAGAALSVIAGSYRGLRLVELARFRPVTDK